MKGWQIGMVATLRQRFLGISLAHVSLVFIGLAWVLPFQLGYHQIPIPTFYQEWGAVVFGLCAMPFLVTKRYWQQPEIPRIVLLPIGLLLLVWLQFALDKVGYLGQALLVSLYFLWAALMIMLGQRLRVELGLPVLATALAAFLLFGCELSALTGIAQYYGWRNVITDNFVVLKKGVAIIANVGQPNHFADYIALGLVSLGLLCVRWQLRVWQAAPLALPLLFVLLLSGSRSSWLYLLCLSGMAFLWQRRDKSNAPLLRYSLLLLLGFGLMHFVVQIPWLAGSSGNVTATERLVGEMTRFIGEKRKELVAEAGSGEPVAAGAKQAAPVVGSKPVTPAADAKQVAPVVDNKPVAPTDGNGQAEDDSGQVALVGEDVQAAGGVGGVSGPTSLGLRLYAWREAWLIFTMFPLLGAGFGQFAWQHFLLGPSLHNPDVTGMYNNAHNFVFQIAAEMGLAGLLVLFATLALWFWQVRSTQRTIYHWWGYCLLAVMGIHGLLEFPLWYTFFLGVAAIVLGMLDDTSYRWPFRGNIGTVGRWSVLAVLLSGLLILSQMLQDYRKLVSLQAVMPQVATADDGYFRQLRDDMVGAQGQATLLRPYIESLLGEAGWNHIADKRALNERVMRHAPTSEVVYREMLLLARDGRQAEARIQIERVIWTYPKDFPGMLIQLERLARMDKDPARFPALLDFALQKYEEWQRATHLSQAG